MNDNSYLPDLDFTNTKVRESLEDLLKSINEEMEEMENEEIDVNSLKFYSSDPLPPSKP